MQDGSKDPFRPDDSSAAQSGESIPPSGTAELIRQIENYRRSLAVVVSSLDRELLLYRMEQAERDLAKLRPSSATPAAESSDGWG